MSRTPWLRAAAFTLAVALVAGLLAAFAAGRFTWGDPEIPKAQCEALTAAATASPTVQAALTRAYQARVATAIIREPQNTWSNLAFVFVGALIWAHDRRTFTHLFAAALIALGIASGLYHASLLPSWRSADVATMGWVSFSLCCIGYSATRRPQIPDEKPSQAVSTDSADFSARDLIVGLLGAALAGLVAYFRNDVHLAGTKPLDTTYTTIAGIGGVFALAVIGIVQAVRTHPQRRVPVAPLAILTLVVAAAVYCQLNDRPGRCFCAPDSILQAHAVWHVLMATAAALAYAMFTTLEGRSAFGRRAT